jgi:hypothetical protein
MSGGDRETRCSARIGAVAADLLRIDWVFMLMFEDFALIILVTLSFLKARRLW